MKIEDLAYRTGRTSGARSHEEAAMRSSVLQLLADNAVMNFSIQNDVIEVAPEYGFRKYKATGRLTLTVYLEKKKHAPPSTPSKAPRSKAARRKKTSRASRGR